MSIATINDDTFAVSLGNSEVKVWSKMLVPGETPDMESRYVWSVVSAINFRDMNVKQIVPSVRLRLSNVA